MSEKKSTQELYKDYVPEVMYYDPEVDGGSDHMIREDLLSEKDRLKKLIMKRKMDIKGDNRVRR